MIRAGEAADGRKSKKFFGSSLQKRTSCLIPKKRRPKAPFWFVEQSAY
jgi:hypothetical protein